MKKNKKEMGDNKIMSEKATDLLVINVESEIYENQKVKSCEATSLWLTEIVPPSEIKEWLSNQLK